MQLEQTKKLPLTLYQSWPGLENFADIPGDLVRMPAPKKDSKVGCPHNPVDTARFDFRHSEKFQHNFSCKSMWLAHRIREKFNFLLPHQ